MYFLFIAKKEAYIRSKKPHLAKQLDSGIPLHKLQDEFSASSDCLSKKRGRPKGSKNKIKDGDLKDGQPKMAKRKKESVGRKRIKKPVPEEFPMCDNGVSFSIFFRNFGIINHVNFCSFS